MKIAKISLTSFLLLAISLGASAQKAIDSTIASLEKSSDVQVFYTEKRNPATKKIYKESKTLILSKLDHVKRIRNAFNAERENSTEATRSKGGIMSLTFRTKDAKAEYNLVENANGGVLTVERREYSRYPKGDGYIINGKKLEFDGGNLNNIEKLDLAEGMLDYDFDSAFKIFDELDWDNISARITDKVNKSVSKKLKKRKIASSRSKGKRDTTIQQTVTTITNSNGKTVAMVYSL